MIEKFMILESALLCLSLNVYFEGRGEPLAGQKAIASVTYNRANQDQKKVCEEVYKPHQFSWTKITKSAKAIRLKNSMALRKVKDEKAWKKAKKVARIILIEKHRFKRATYYHTKQVQPRWSKSKDLRLVATIGNHKFYKKIRG